jgi:hypothetical protein
MERIDTSCPGDSARSAATVQRSFGRIANGSNEYHRIAFSCVILARSSSDTPSATAIRLSAGVGHDESECG